jgi:hypothetical protein
VLKRKGERVQFHQEVGDFGGAAVLIPVVLDGTPEGDQVPIDGNRLIHLHGADSGITDRF